MRPRLTALLLLLASSTALSAATPPHWIELHSDHFLILTDSSEKDARSVAVQFERMRSVFHTLLPTGTADTGQITVLAFKDKKGFQSVEPAAYLAKGQIELDGLFLRTYDRNYILVRLDNVSGQEHPYSTVYHEYTHVLNSKADWMPLWLNEGLAEFFQNTDIDAKGVLLGQPSTGDVLYLRENRLLPLTTLFKVDHSSPYYHDEQKGSVFYAESWALTHLLRVSDASKHTHYIHDYVSNLMHGQDSLTAARNAFGDLNKLEDELNLYVKRSDFKAFKLPASVPIDESTFKVRTISTADANATRADVLVYDDRQAEALALLNDTLRDDPRNALAHETMGLLKFRAGDIPAARKWYDEAIQLGSDSCLAHFYAAVFALQSGDTSHPDAIEANLQSAIRLDPTFAPADDALANFYAQRREKLDEAHTLNIHAIQLDPTNLNYRLNAANVLMQQNDPANALNVLKAAEHIASTPTDVAIIQSRRRQIEQYQAAQHQSNPSN